jgi:hypothetical protein
LETGRFWIPGTDVEVVEAVEPEVDEELATVVVGPDVVVGPAEPPDVHDAITRATPPIRATVALRPAAVPRDRSPDRSLFTGENLPPGPDR